MSKHTKGPWTIKNDKGHNWEVNRLIGSQGENLGDLYTAPRVGEEAEYEANAKLIAAAPELLAALQEYVKACEFQGIKLGAISGTACDVIRKATSISN